jgi:hypothetical protein
LYLTIYRRLFLGRAYDKLEKPEESEKVYNEATTIKPADDQAWQGLRALYEAQGSKMVDKFLKVSEALAEIYAAAYVVNNIMTEFQEADYCPETIRLAARRS